MGQVLVLDAGYQPVQQVEIKRVMRWIVKRRIEIVEEHPTKYVNSEKWSIKAPSIVRLLVPVRRKRAIKFSRHNVYQRDKGRCQYCGQHVSRDRFTYDHVIPRSQGGRTEWTNVVVACASPCNQKKANRTPEQAGMRLLSIPTKPKSLPDLRREIAYVPGLMPASWADYLRSSVYWNSELEEG